MAWEDVADYYHFTGPARFEKAVGTLLGLLKGFASDGRVTLDEMKQYYDWMEAHEEFSDRPPFPEVIATVRRMVNSGVYDEEELADAIWCCSQIQEDGAYWDLATADMQILHAMMGGIVADGVVTTLELQKLQQWLDEHEHLKGCWPFDEVESLILHVLRDGRIDAREHELLLAFLGEFAVRGTHRSVGMPLNEIGKPIQALCAVCPEVTFQQKTFCFTGESSRLTRSELAKIVAQRGGSFHPRITKSIDYLVVGANGNPCWAFSCYGRKVEQAIALRKEGSKLLLVHEADFWDAIG